MVEQRHEMPRLAPQSLDGRPCPSNSAITQRDMICNQPWHVDEECSNTLFTYYYTQAYYVLIVIIII